MNQYLEKNSQSPLYLQLMQRIRNALDEGCFEQFYHANVNRLAERSED
jgi:DNA-binding transcriptional regulator YhcF (GntR family)